MEKAGKLFRLGKMLQKTKGKTYEEKREIIIEIMNFVRQEKRMLKDVNDEWIEKLKKEYNIDERTVGDTKSKDTKETEEEEEELNDFLKFKMNMEKMDKENK